MAADVEGVQRLLEELHRLGREGFPDSEVCKRIKVFSKVFIVVAILRPGGRVKMNLKPFGIARMFFGDKLLGVCVRFFISRSERVHTSDRSRSR